MFSTNLSDTSVVVTGGSSGIGLSTVSLFLQQGARVAFCGRDANKLQEAERTLKEKFPTAILYTQVCDVVQENEVRDFTKKSAQILGGIDILVNNAGQGRVSTFESTTDEAWLAELQLKFFSNIYPIRASLPYLEQSTKAAIVCVNSLLAFQPEPHMVATSAARAGVANLVRSLAVEFAPKNIRVNGILIGLVDSGQWRKRFAERSNPDQTWVAWSSELAKTKQIPLGRLGDPTEAAQAIFFLGSTLSSYTTGSHIDISGGLSRYAR